MPNNFANGYAPRGWLDDTTSQAYLAAHGAACLETFGVWRDTVKVRYASTAPEDALVWIGEARQIDRAPRETATAYRGPRRLGRCFGIHEERTTKDCYRNALEPLGVDPSTVEVFNHYEAGVGDWWSCVYGVIDMRDGPWTVDEWDAGDWDDGGVWDLNGVTEYEIVFFRRNVRRWKWSGAYPVAFWAWTSGDIWDDGGFWDEGDWDSGGTGVAFPILLGHTWEEGDLLYGADPELWDDDSTWEEAFPG